MDKLFNTKVFIKKCLSKIPILSTSLINYANKKYAKQFPQNFLHIQDPKKKEILETVLHQGFCVLPNYFDSNWCKKCQDELDTVIQNNPKLVASREDERIFGAENASPIFKEFHDNPFFQEIADIYMGEHSPPIYTLAARIIHNKDIPLGSGGDWHRDAHLRLIKTLVYLEDVTDKNGPFQFIKSSNDFNQNQYNEDIKLMNVQYRDKRFTPKTLEPLLDKNPNRLTTFTAKKGTVIFVDTSGLHRGMPLISGKRYALFNYYRPKRKHAERKETAEKEIIFKK